LTIPLDNGENEFDLGPRENQYIAFEETGPGLIGLDVALIRGLGVHVLSVQGAPPSMFPRDYDRPHWGVRQVTVVWHHSQGTVGGLMIHNPASWEVAYRIQTWFEGSPTTAEASESQVGVGMIVGVSIGSAVLIAAILLAVVCYRRRHVARMETMSEPMIPNSSPNAQII
jgi:hypothetical protein